MLNNGNVADIERGRAEGDERRRDSECQGTGRAQVAAEDSRRLVPMLAESFLTPIPSACAPSRAQCVPPQ